MNFTPSNELIVLVVQVLYTITEHSLCKLCVKYSYQRAIIVFSAEEKMH